jgi:hypothetical protein
MVEHLPGKPVALSLTPDTTKKKKKKKKKENERKKEGKTKNQFKKMMGRRKT